MKNQEIIALLKKNPISVGCAVVALGLGLGVYLRSDEEPTLRKQLDQVSTEGQRLETNAKYAAQLHEQLAALSTARDEIEPRIVHASELAKNLQYFYKIEADTGVKITDLHQNNLVAGKPGAKSIYSPINFTVSVEGEYAAVLDFLRRIENGTHYSRTLAADLSKGGNAVDRTGPLKLGLTLELLGQP